MRPYVSLPGDGIYMYRTHRNIVSGPAECLVSPRLGVQGQTNLE